MVEADHGFEEQLLSVVADHGLHQHVTEPTRFRGTTTPSTLDLVFTRFENDIQMLNKGAPLGKSNHAMVSFNFRLHWDEHGDRPFRLYRRAQPNSISDAAAKMDWSTGDDPANFYVRTTHNLMKVTEELASLITKRKSRKKPWVTSGLLRALKDRNRAWAVYKVQGGHSCYLTYKGLRNRADALNKKLRISYEAKIAKEALSNPKRYHAYVQSKKALRKSVEALKFDGQYITDEFQIAEKLCDCFSAVHRADQIIPIPMTTDFTVTCHMGDFIITEGEV
jgi:hypothetical protein